MDLSMPFLRPNAHLAALFLGGGCELEGDDDGFLSALYLHGSIENSGHCPALRALTAFPLRCD